MSYIRPLSNPEGLYIFGTKCRDGRERVEILTAGEGLLIPRYAFHGVLSKWKEVCYWDESVRFRGAEMRCLTREELGIESPEFHPDLYRWSLRWKGWEEGKRVTAWLVTWMYVARDIEERTP